MSEQPRIGPLAILPLFHRLEGRKVVIVGASQGADWKADLLSATGARVERLTGHWTGDQLAQAVLAVGEFSDQHEARLFADIAHRQGALVNIIDFPELCDVQFGTIVNRSPIVIGISTDGAAPMLGQSIRTRIEAILPFGLSAWAAAAKDWRVRLKHQLGEFQERRNFWQGFVRYAWANSDCAPKEADLAELAKGQCKIAGRAVIISAWSHDPELLTLKAVNALQSATVIFYDCRISREVLELGRREATRFEIKVGDRELTQMPGEIDSQMIELANRGEFVVYLTSLGMPAVHSLADRIRGSARELGVAIIPGVRWEEPSHKI